MTLAPLGDTDVWAHVADQRPTARRLAQTVTGVDVTGWDGIPAFKVSSFLHSPFTALCPHTSSSLQKKCLHERMVIHTRTFISELEDAQSLGLVLHSRYKGQG